MEETRRDAFVCCVLVSFFPQSVNYINRNIIIQTTTQQHNFDASKKREKKREYAKLISVKNGNFMPLCKLVSI